MSRQSKRGPVGLGLDVEKLASANERDEKRPRKAFSTRTLNTRFVVTTSAAMTMAFVGVVGLHSVQQTRLTDELLSRAEAAVRADSEEAEQGYREYLQFRPNDLDVRLTLARLQMESADTPSDWRTAYRTNEQVLRADPTLVEIRRKQVDVCFHLGRWRDAQVHLKILLEAEPTDGALHMLMALAADAQRRFSEAQTEYQSAIEHGFPSVAVQDHELTPVDAHVNLARILREEFGETNQADRVYEKLVKENLESSDAYFRRALYHRQNGRREKALKDTRHAMKLAPDDVDAVLLTSELALAESETTEEEIESLKIRLKSLSDSAPDDDDRVFRMLAEIAIRQGESDEAINILKDRIAQNGKNVDIRAMLVSHLLSQGSIREAEKQLAELQAQQADADIVSPLSDFYEGSMKLQLGEPYDALDGLRIARSKSLMNPIVSQLATLQVGRCYLAMGFPKRALAEFRSVLQDDPESVDAAKGVALALIGSGDHLEAARVLRDLPIRDIPTAIQWAELELQLVLRHSAEQRDWERVEDAVELANSIEADSPETSLVEAKMLIARGANDEALSRLETASESFPDDPRFPAMLARLALSEQNLEMTREILEIFEANHPPHPEIAASWLQYWRRADETKLAQRIEEIEQQEFPKHPAEWTSLRQLIASDYARRGDRAGFLRVMREIAQSQPDQVENWFRLVGPALALGADEIRDEAMGHLERLDGAQGTYARCADAMCLIQDNQSTEGANALKDARQILTEIVSDRSDWSPPYTLLGQLAMQAGERNNAADWFKQAIANGNRDVGVLRLTADLMVDLRQPQEAIDLLETIRSESAGELRSNMDLLMFELQAKQDQTGEFFRQAAPELLDNLGEAGNGVIRGQLLWANGRYDQAEEEFRQVVEAEPSQPIGWLTLIHFLSGRGDLAAAKEALADAEPKLRQSGAVIALAGCYELTGNQQQAEQELQELTEAEPNNGGARIALASLHVRSGHPEKVESLLRPLLDSTDQFSSVNLVAVRRILASSIAFTSFANFSESLKLVQENIDTTVERSTDQRLKARLLMSHTHPDFVKQGIHLLDVVEKKVALTVPEKLLFAQAYDRMEKHAEADREWAKLLEEHPENSQVLEAYVRRQLQQDDEFNMETGIGNRIRQSLTGPARIELIARIDVHNGNIETGISKLREYSEATIESEEQQHRKLQVAGWLSEMATSASSDSDTRDRLIEEADSLLQPMTSSSAEAGMQRASLLSQGNRLAEALEQLEQIEPPLPEIQKVALGVQCIQFVDHADPAVYRVDKWADAILVSSPTNLQILHFKEALCRRLGQYDRAIELNRQILKNAPRQVAALNNLAWLLATQEDNHAEALRMVNLAIDQSGPLFFLLDTRGLVYLEAGNARKAIADFETSWMQRKLPSTMFHYSRALAQSGDDTAAEEKLHLSIKKGLRASMLEVAELPALQELCSTYGMKIPNH